MKVILLVTGLLLAGCGGEGTEDKSKLVLRGEAMGTGWSVVLSDRSEVPEGLRTKVEGAIDSVELAMSTWVEESEVSRFNDLPKGEAMELSAATFQVVACALEIWKESEGRFDVTVGSEANGGSENLTLDRDNRSLTKKRDGVSIDLSAIAKGYAVDVVAETLDEAGVENYLVEIGGELRGRGLNVDGKVWVVGVERPDVGGGKIAGKVGLTEMSIATSGNYQQPRHLIDPKSGDPVESNLMAVCVLHKSAMVADAWATALFVAGVEEGIRLAEAKGLAVAYIIVRGKLEEPEVRTSKVFRWSEIR